MREHAEPLIRKFVWRFNSSCSNHSSRRSQFHLHGRQRIRHKLPVIILQRTAGNRRPAHTLGFFPRASGTALPVPVEQRPMDPLCRFGNIIFSGKGGRLRQYLNPFLFLYLPSVIRVSYALGIVHAMEHETDSIADLRQRSKHTKIPHNRRQYILPRTQKRANVIGLVPPMPKIALRWPRAHPLLVHVKNELIVRAHLHHKVLRLLRQINGLPEVQHNLISLWRIRRSDPLRTPYISGHLGRHLRERRSGPSQSRHQ